MNNRVFSVLRKKIIKYLKGRLCARLFNHCLGVEAAAVQTAAASSNYGLIMVCSIAGLLHDAAKGLTLLEMQKMASRAGYRLRKEVFDSEGLLHGHASAAIARHEFGISDSRIIAAIRHHTLGRLKMGAAEKIIFISDYVEPTRAFPGVESIRRAVFEATVAGGLDCALLLVARDKIRSLASLNIRIDNTLFEVEKKLAAKLTAKLNI